MKARACNGGLHFKISHNIGQCTHRWNEMSEQALHYARTQTFARLKKDKVTALRQSPRSAWTCVHPVCHGKALITFLQLVSTCCKRASSINWLYFASRALCTP